MPSLGLLRLVCSARLRAAAGDALRSLPAYRVALWPDGWECRADGSILVRDTDAMAEARRWYALADRNHGHIPLDRVMRLHGTFVPRSILSLGTHRFASESVASVAVLLVAGDWVRQRRRQLIADAPRALLDRALCWSGSRSDEGQDTGLLGRQVQGLIAQCERERMIPRVRHRVRLQSKDGFGLRGYRCIVEVDLDPYARRCFAEALAVALIPWNRAVVRDGRPCTLIEVETQSFRRADARQGDPPPRRSAHRPRSLAPFRSTRS